MNFAVGEVILSSVRMAGSRLILGGLILCGSRQIPGWFLACSRPKRQPKLFQDGERDGQMGQDIFKISQKGDLDDPKKLPEAYLLRFRNGTNDFVQCSYGGFSANSRRADSLRFSADSRRQVMEVLVPKITHFG